MFWFFLFFLIFTGVAISIWRGGAKRQAGSPQGTTQWREAHSVAVAGGMIAILCAVFALVCLLIASTTVVGAREIGIVTTYDAYHSTLGPGWHLVPPWSDTETFTTRINRDKEKVAVTLKSEAEGTPGATADVSLAVRWHIADVTHAKSLWSNYKTFGEVSDVLMDTEIASSTRATLGEYTPSAAKDGENIRPIAGYLQRDLQENVTDDGVVIDSVSLSNVDLEKTVEDRLRAVIAQQGDLAKSRVELQQATIDAQANKARQSGLTPQTLAQSCIELLRAAIDQHYDQPLPATLNCGITGVSGAAQTPIIVGQK